MHYKTGVVLVLVAAVLWSAMGLAIRQIEVAGTWALLFWRSAGMVPVLAGFIWWNSGAAALLRLGRVGWPGVIGALGLVLAFAGAIHAIQSTTVANAVFLLASQPFLTAILGRIFLHEKLRPATWAAIGLAGIGMYIMLREGLVAGSLTGNLAALVSAIGFSVFSVALRWGKAGDMLPSIVLGGVFSMLTAAAILALQGGSLAVPGRDIGMAMAMGAAILGLGLSLYTLGSRVIPAAEMTLLALVEVLLAPVWVWLFMGETASSATFLGGAVVLAAVGVNAVMGVRAWGAADLT